MLSQCLVQSITKKVISYLLVLGQQPLRALQYILKYIWKIIIYLKTYVLKSLETFLIRKNDYSNAKKIQIRQKKSIPILIWQQIP